MRSAGRPRSSSASAHPATTGQLNLVELQEPFRCEPSPRRVRAGVVRPQREQPKQRAARHLSRRAARPRLVCANLPLQLSASLFVSSSPSVAPKRAGHRRGAVLLLLAAVMSAAEPSVEVSKRQQRAALPRQICLRAAATSHRPSSGVTRLRHDRARVETGVHQHQRHACLGDRQRGSRPGSATLPDSAAATMGGCSARHAVGRSRTSRARSGRSRPEPAGRAPAKPARLPTPVREVGWRPEHRNSTRPWPIRRQAGQSAVLSSLREWAL